MEMFDSRFWVTCNKDPSGQLKYLHLHHAKLLHGRSAIGVRLIGCYLPSCSHLLCCSDIIPSDIRGYKTAVTLYRAKFPRIAMVGWGSGVYLRGKCL
jgi:hypothetical protein